MNIKSPLRYPGGKSRAIKTISEYLPEKFSEFREPFVGGGSVFIYLKQQFPNLKISINDLNPELFLFWHLAKSEWRDLKASFILSVAACKINKINYSIF